MATQYTEDLAFGNPSAIAATTTGEAGCGGPSMGTGTGV